VRVLLNQQRSLFGRDADVHLAAVQAARSA
jgi:hypothetical protein